MAGDSEGSTRTARRRPGLTRERVLKAAMRLADRNGIEALSMRKLGLALRVEAMSLYKHVADKEDLLDGLADLVMDEVELPAADVDWRTAIRRTAISVHDALLRHPWAAPVLETRVTPGPARLRFLDAVVGTIRGAGFPLPVVARAFMALDSHIYGFAIQEAGLRRTMAAGPQAAGDIAGRAGAGFPNLRDIALGAASNPDAYPVDFEFGLDLLLDGLERARPPTRAAG